MKYFLSEDILDVPGLHSWSIYIGEKDPDYNYLYGFNHLEEVYRFLLKQQVDMLSLFVGVGLDCQDLIDTITEWSRLNLSLSNSCQGKG